MSQIPLSNRPGVFVTVDAEDVDALSRSRWMFMAGGYAVATTSDHRYMHREILGLVSGDGLQGDHINGDKLDNRRANLRAISQAENLRAFKAPRPGATSRYRGVSWSKDRERWVANARLADKQHPLGRFHSEEEAAAAVNAFWVEHGYPAPNHIEEKAA